MGGLVNNFCVCGGYSKILQQALSLVGIESVVVGNEFHHYNSSNLISNGYLKKKELLDVDGKSYCDVYVKVYKYNYQDSCEMSYKLFLKCEDFKEKGYINWG